jgi:thioredoxin reductase (NADPH)
MLDCIIIGSGIGGISSALTLKANGKSFVLLGSKDLSVKISRAEKVNNYPAFLGGSGEEFCALLKTQLEREEITVKEGRATGVYALTDKFAVLTQDGETLEARTVILACGVESGKRIDGETQFLGRGVSYCATCDGFLYKNKKIAVVCLSKEFEREAEYLSKIADKTYLFPLYKGVELSGEKIEKIIKMPTKIIGNKRVEKICYGNEEIEVDGVFILKESLPPETLVAGLETENGHVKINRNTETNLSGLFAVGDITGRPYQYAKAVGEGNVAAHAVTEYLNKNS